MIDEPEPAETALVVEPEETGRPAVTGELEAADDFEAPDERRAEEAFREVLGPTTFAQVRTAEPASDGACVAAA